MGCGKRVVDQCIAILGITIMTHDVKTVACVREGFSVAIDGVTSLT